MSDLQQARKDYDNIIQGREGHWLDPGEYEDLKQEWFDTHALKLMKLLEGHATTIQYLQTQLETYQRQAAKQYRHDQDYVPFEEYEER